MSSAIESFIGIGPSDTLDHAAVPGVRLAMLDEAHLPALFSATPADTFRYFQRWPSDATLPSFVEYLTTRFIGNPSVRSLVVLDAATGQPLGSSSFLDIDPANRCVEIGATWYVSAARGTAVNPSCKWLMLRHAFEVCGCVRVTIKCDNRNEHSKRAIVKLGATFEGVLRQHRILEDGFVRDTAYFSVIAGEWPAMSARLLERINRPASHA